MNTKAKGTITEGAVLAALLRSGKVVLMPFGDNQRYDMVIDEAGKFVRVQCKTGRVRGGGVVFNTVSVHSHRSKPEQSYEGQADLFGVYCPELAKVYLVPISVVARSKAYLRLQPKNNTKPCHLASSFEV